MKHQFIFHCLALLCSVFYTHAYASDSVTLNDGTTLSLARYRCISSYLFSLSNGEQYHLIQKCIDPQYELPYNVIKKLQNKLVDEDGEVFADAQKFILLAWTDGEGNIVSTYRSPIKNYNIHKTALVV